MNPSDAYKKVRNALRTGALVRPLTCQRCGVNPGLASDGRSKIQAHHADYSRPLDVEWICAKCHREETPLPEIIGGVSFGENNGQARLTEEAVRVIRDSGLGCRKLALKFGVDKKTIQRVRRNETWKI
jgi:hypothetical protein